MLIRDLTRFIFLPLETIFIILASCNWISVDFEDGVLVKRMGTLTLVVLGEGIIVLIKSVETVTNSEISWHASLGITIISALIIIVSTVHSISTNQA